jgi:eukaryotic-like serine/threonine-protein kinase
LGPHAIAESLQAVPYGKYQLLQRIAVGGMAELFLAQDPMTGERLVIKRILPYLSNEAEFVQMFLDEARIASQLHHPNIIQVLELGQLEDAIFIAMELVDGVDLRKILQEEEKRGRTLPIEIAAYIVAQICAGLHYAHNCLGLDGRPLGVVHRDVSPQNVMVGFDGRVKLVDFGIAKAGILVDRSKPGVVKGKFLYLAPEQLTREKIDHRADLFSLGTTLYEVTTGKSPFLKNSTEAVIYAIRGEDPPPPHLGQPSYPLELSRIVMRCLVKDRTQRYQQAGEIEADLKAFLARGAAVDAVRLADYAEELFGRTEERTLVSLPTHAALPQQVRVQLGGKESEQNPTSLERAIRTPQLLGERDSQPTRPLPSERKPEGVAGRQVTAEFILQQAFQEGDQDRSTMLTSPSKLVEIFQRQGGELGAGGTGEQPATHQHRAAALAGHTPPPTLLPQPKRALSREILPGAAPQVFTGPPMRPPGPPDATEPSHAQEAQANRRGQRVTLVVLAVACLITGAVLSRLLIPAPVAIAQDGPEQVEPRAEPPADPPGAPAEEPGQAQAAPPDISAAPDPTPDPVVAAQDPPKAPVSGKPVAVLFKAPRGTAIAVGKRAFRPGPTYRLQPADLEIRYRCPKKRTWLTREYTLEEGKRGTQAITLRCDRR